MTRVPSGVQLSLDAAGRIDSTVPQRSQVSVEAGFGEFGGGSGVPVCAASGDDRAGEEERRDYAACKPLSVRAHHSGNVFR